MFLTLPPIKIRTGRFEDCKNVCYLNERGCKYFIFFTDKFVGNLTNMCVMFKEEYGKKIHMPGVISGAAREYIIPHEPIYPDNDDETTTESIVKSTKSSTTPISILYDNNPVSTNMLMISLGLCILLFFTLVFLVLYCYHEF